MPGTLVSKLSSTRTRPVFSSTATPASSRPRPACTAGGRRRPAPCRPGTATSLPLLLALTMTWPPWVEAALTWVSRWNVSPCLTSDLCSSSAISRVAQRQDARQELEHGHLGPQPAPDRAQLQADVAAPTTIRCCGTLSNASASVELTMFVPSKGRAGKLAGSLPVARQMAWPPAGSDSSPAAPLDDDLARARRSRRGAVDRRDPVLLEQEGDAVGQSLDDLVLALSIAAEVEARPRRPVMPCCAKWFLAWAYSSLESSRALLGMQPMLRQVPPSVPRFSIQARLHAELRRPDGGDIAARTGADHHQVVSLRHGPPREQQEDCSHFQQQPLGVLDALLDAHQELTASRPSIRR